MDRRQFLKLGAFVALAPTVSKLAKVGDAAAAIEPAQVDFSPPVGTIFPSVGEVPEGYLLCCGQTLSVKDYPKLYALIGNTLPDTRGRHSRGSYGSYNYIIKAA